MQACRIIPRAYSLQLIRTEIIDLNEGLEHFHGWLMLVGKFTNCKRVFSYALFCRSLNIYEYPPPTHISSSWHNISKVVNLHESKRAVCTNHIIVTLDFTFLSPNYNTQSWLKYMHAQVYIIRCMTRLVHVHGVWSCIQTWSLLLFSLYVYIVLSLKAWLVMSTITIQTNVLSTCQWILIVLQCQVKIVRMAGLEKYINRSQ